MKNCTYVISLICQHLEMFNLLQKNVILQYFHVKVVSDFGESNSNLLVIKGIILLSFSLLVTQQQMSLSPNFLIT